MFRAEYAERAQGHPSTKSAHDDTVMVEHDQKNKVHDTATKDARSCRAKHSLHTQLKEHAHASTQREKVERRAIITHEAGERDGERRMKSYKGRIALMEVM